MTGEAEPPGPGPGAPWLDGTSTGADAGVRAFVERPLGPPPAPWLEDDAPYEADAGRDAVEAGLRALLRVPHLLAAAAHAFVVFLGGLILLGAVLEVGRRPVPRVLAACLAGAIWTWLVTGWVRASLGRALRVGGVVPRETRFPRARFGPAEAAAALAATPVLTTVLLLPIGLQLLPGLTLPVAFLFPLVAVGLAVTLVAGLLPPLGACGLSLGFELPPLAALAIVARGARRGWRALLTVVAAHTLSSFLVVLVTLALPPLAFIWLVWLPLQGTAGSLALLALAAGWARGAAAADAGPVRFRARPPESPPWLLPAAGALLRVAYGAALAVWAVIDAAGRLGLSLGGISVALGAVFVPWLGGLALLRQHHLRHRRVDLDDLGLLLDAGPAWVGTRTPWSEVRGARARDDGVALVVGWSLVSSVVLVRLPSDQVDPLLQWLDGRGVRRLDGE